MDSTTRNTPTTAESANPTPEPQYVQTAFAVVGELVACGHIKVEFDDRLWATAFKAP